MLLAIGVWAVVGVVTAPSAPATPRVSPSAYHISYRITTSINNVNQSTSQDVWVQRPWSSRVDTRDASGKLISETVTTPDHAYISSGAGLLDLGQPRPVPPTGDYHLDAILGDLLQRHLARQLGTSTVIGERCTNIRTGEPLGNAFAAPTSDEYVDICVSHDGLMLREDWWRHRARIRLTEATAVQRGPVDPAKFVVTNAAPVDPSLAPDRVQPFSTKQLPRDTTWFWRARHPPWQLRLVGRFRAAGNLGGTTASVVTIDVYRHGNVVIAVTQQPAGAAPTAGQVEHVAGVGAGRSTVTPGGADLHLVGRGVDIDVRGTASVAQLRWFVRSLHPTRTG